MTRAPEASPPKSGWIFPARYATMQMITSKSTKIRIIPPGNTQGLRNRMNRKDLFRPYDGNEKYIFVSYNHDDSDTVYEIITAFHERGYRLWHDKGIPVGENFLEQLAKRVKGCEVFFCFLSPEYINSQYCMRELSFAVNNKKTIIPIMLKDFELPDSVAFQVVMINWTYLSWFDSTAEFADQLAETAAQFLEPCKEETEGGSGGGLPPAPPPRPRRTGLIIAAAAVVIAALAAVFLLTRPPETPAADAPAGTEAAPAATEAVPETTETAPAATEEAAPETTEAAPAATEAAPETAEPEPEATEALLPAVKPEDLSASALKTLRYLSGLAEAGCPLPVYGREGAEEADNVYDNAVAALALLSECVKHPNRSGAALRKILDSLTERVNGGPAFAAETPARSLAAAATALLQYDSSIKNSVSYVRAAQKILDKVLETNVKGGFKSARNGARFTEDNLWLYAAYSMLASRTGNKAYEEAAGSAKDYVLSMLPEGGTFFLAGDDTGDLLSVRTQALAALILQDSRGLAAASALRINGGFPPDDRTSGGISTEDTLLAALALRASGAEDEAAAALAAVYACRAEDGSIPETDGASLNDGLGRTYTRGGRTSAAGWFALAAEGYNPLQGAGPK